MVKLVELKCRKCGATLENAYEGVEYEEDDSCRASCVTIPSTYYMIQQFNMKVEHHFLVCRYCGSKYYIER